MRHHICFIDDDAAFEIPLFREAFGEGFDVIAADSYEQARSLIAARDGWAPELFVLDLYFPSGEPDEAAVDALRAAPLAIEDDRAEIRAAYTNFSRATDRLARVLDAWRQGPEGGLKLAGRIAADLPDVPIVFYSRKATFEDVVRCLAAPNVRAVERKPTGTDDADTRRLTHAEAPRLAERFRAVIAGSGLDETRLLKDAARTVAQHLLHRPARRRSD